MSKGQEAKLGASWAQPPQTGLLGILTRMVEAAALAAVRLGVGAGEASGVWIGEGVAAGEGVTTGVGVGTGEGGGDGVVIGVGEGEGVERGLGAREGVKAGEGESKGEEEAKGLVGDGVEDDAVLYEQAAKRKRRGRARRKRGIVAKQNNTREKG